MKRNVRYIAPEYKELYESIVGDAEPNSPTERNRQHDFMEAVKAQGKHPADWSNVFRWETIEVTR